MFLFKHVRRVLVLEIVFWLLSLWMAGVDFVFFLGGVNLLFLFLLYSQTWISKILNRSTHVCACTRKEVFLLRARVCESVRMCLCFFCDSYGSVFLPFMFSFLIFCVLSAFFSLSG